MATLKFKLYYVKNIHKKYANDKMGYSAMDLTELIVLI